MTNSTSRILAAGKEVLNDTHVTRMNNNDLIIGATGAGKTTGTLSRICSEHRKA